MRTLITGGKGLVGSAIESDFKPSRQQVDLMHVDNIIRYITSNKIDSIIHCAGRVGGIKANSEKPAEFFYENIIINTNVLEAARATGVEKVVSFLSTCVFPDKATYPLTIDQIHTGEPHTSNYAYAYAKRMVDVQSRAYRQQYGCNFVTVIPCNIYGPNDNFNLDSGHVIPSLIHKCYLAKQNNTDLEVWGTGSPCREFLYSHDAGNIAKWALKNYDEPDPLILSPDEGTSVATIASLVAYHMKFDGNIIYNGKQDGQYRKPSDSTRLGELLPDYRFESISTGIEKSVKWFIDNFKDARK